MSKYEQIKEDFIEALTTKKAGTTPYDTEASVVRVDGSTAWVHIPGGVTETPVAMTINCAAGDKVQVRVSGGSAWLTGNETAPPTDDRVAKVAQNTAVLAEGTAAEAKETAEQAQAAAGAVVGIAQQAIQIAGDTAQHFWFTETGVDTGAHITEVTQDVFENAPTGPNLLARSNGIAVRDGLTELATFGTQIVLGNGASFMMIDQTGFGVTFDGGLTEAIAAHLASGTTSTETGGFSNVIMQPWGFRAEQLNTDIAAGYSITLALTMTSDYGTYNESVTLTAGTSAQVTAFEYSGMGIVINYDGYIGLTFSNRYTWNVTLTANITYTIQTDRDAYFTLGQRKSGGSIGKYSHGLGYDVIASGDYSHAEGYRSTASDNASHAEGSGSTASGQNSHAEGRSSTSSALAAHAEGYLTSATGGYSHAEGNDSWATGISSHAQNEGTRARSNYQTALGKYNIEDNNSDYSVIVGNGSNTLSRSNALALAWDGETELALDTTAASGTDYDLYTAITSLGWASDVIA